MICASCNKDVQTFFEVEPGIGLVEKCPACFAVQPKQQLQTNSGLAQLVERAAVNRECVGSSPTARATPNNNEPPLNPMKLLKERIKFLKAQIKELRKCEKECAQLEKLVSAAKQPRSKVRALHAIK